MLRKKYGWLDIKNVVIPFEFQMSKPSIEKISKAKQFIEKYNHLDKPVVFNYYVEEIDYGTVVSEKYALADNYTRYLAAKELGIKKVPCMGAIEYYGIHSHQRNFIPYITAVFPDTLLERKEYVWKNPKLLNISVGDTVVVKTAYKNSHKIHKDTVIITGIYWDLAVNLTEHKEVIKVLKR